MPVSGLVVTLVEDDTAERTIRRLRADERFGVGELQGPRLAVALETDTVVDHERMLDDLEADEGVLFVELVFHDFSDVREVATPPGRKRVRPRVTQ